MNPGARAAAAVRSRGRDGAKRRASETPAALPHSGLRTMDRARHLAGRLPNP